jgi:hypothetical protein
MEFEVDGQPHQNEVILNMVAERMGNIRFHAGVAGGAEVEFWQMIWP